MRSRSSLLPAALALALASPAATACDPGVRIGNACEYNSDCAEGLACVNGHCGAECHVHRDCPLESECLIADETGIGRCRLPDDTCSQCATGLVCGSDGLCHSPCAQCPSDGVCVEGACVRSSADAGVVDAPPSSGDGGTPFLHPTCVTSADCTGGASCESFQGTPGVCRVPCLADTECAPGARCARFGDDDQDHCSIPCDPVTNEGCPEGTACDMVNALSNALERMDAGTIYVQTWECRTESGAPAGTSCTAVEQCGVGQSCYYSGASDDAGLRQDCVLHCYTNASVGSAGACPAGFHCQAWSTPSPVPGHAIGFCRLDAS